MKDSARDPSHAQLDVPAALRPYVQAIELSDGTPGVPYRILPGLAPVLGFQYRGRISVQRPGGGSERLALAGITGLLPGARLFVPEGPTGSVLVRFTPFGAFALLGCAMDELADRHVALADLPGGDADLPERIAQVQASAALTMVRDWLLATLQRQGRELHADLVLAVRRLVASDGAARIDRMARELGVGRRQLERLFKLQVGVGPKEFASLARFGSALRHIDGQNAWADVAAAAGYADQAHFIRNFRRRTGLRPTEYRLLLRATAR